MNCRLIDWPSLLSTSDQTVVRSFDGRPRRTLPSSRLYAPGMGGSGTVGRRVVLRIALTCERAAVAALTLLRLTFATILLKTNVRRLNDFRRGDRASFTVDSCSCFSCSMLRSSSMDSFRISVRRDVVLAQLEAYSIPSVIFSTRLFSCRALHRSTSS